MSVSILMIERVAEGLGELVNEVVFVGGSVAVLYRENPAADTVRPTDDIDFIIEVTSYHEYDRFISKCRKHGFKDDLSSELSSICRLLYQGIKVDAIPADSSAIGFSNKWYESGVKNSIQYILPSGKTIRILPLPYYIATKIEAYHSRGDDIRVSHDLEDCFMIFDGLRTIHTFQQTDKSVSDYLRSEFTKLLDDDQFIDAIEGSLSGSTRKQKAARVLSIIKSLT